MDLGAAPPLEPSRDAERRYLLVIEGASSSLIRLPRDGVLLIGRAPDCDVQIEDVEAARRHAKVIVTRGEPRIIDLDSPGGTWVNGERLDGARPLASGDIIRIGETTLVPRTGRRAPPERVLD